MLERDITTRIHDVVAEYDDLNVPALVGVELPAINSSLLALLQGLRTGRDLSRGAPEHVIEEARLAAQAGVDLHTILQTHRIAQSVTWETLMDACEEGLGDSPQRSAVMRVVSRYHFEWNDRMTSEVVKAYQAEREMTFRDRERRRQELVRDLLAGLPVDSAALAYPLSGPHVGLVAWGQEPLAAVKRLAADVGGSLLTVPGPGGSVTAWIGTESLFRTGSSRIAPVSAGTFVATGAVGDGVSGFRLTHRQALQAERIARLRSQPMTRYEDIGLEALVLRDQQLLRDFVTFELGPLLDEDTRSDVLRDTLRAYFATGQNASSAAHVLGVHERTVAYRLRSIEERLGVSIGSRRDQLAAALRFLPYVNRGAGVDGGSAADPA